jgi:hypothetical protein
VFENGSQHGGRIESGAMEVLQCQSGGPSVQASLVNARARAAFKGKSLFDRVDGDKLQ